jgi:hypothetical protein
MPASYFKRLITHLLLSAITGLFVLGLILMAFQYGGVIIALILGIFGSALWFAFNMMFVRKSAPFSVWREAVYNTNKLEAKLVIIRDRAGNILFQNFGDLTKTQLGALFFYGNSILGERKLLTINALSSVEAERPIIEITNTVIETLADSSLYVETKHPLKIAGKDADYHEINRQQAALEVITEYDNNIVEAATRSNPKSIDDKVKQVNLNDLKSKGY